MNMANADKKEKCWLYRETKMRYTRNYVTVWDRVQFSTTVAGSDEMGREHLDVCLPPARYCSSPVTYFLFSLPESNTLQVQLRNVFRFDRCFYTFVVDELFF